MVKPAKWVFAFIMLFVLSSVLFAFNNEDMNKARKYYSSGRYAEAINLIDRYLGYNQKSYEAYNLRGLCHEKRREYEMAEADYQKALNIAPGNSQAKANLQRLGGAKSTGFSRTIEGYKREIALSPNNLNNYLQLGKAYRASGDLKSAETWYGKYFSRASNPGADEVLRYADILAKNNHIAKGESVLEKFSSKYSGDSRLKNKLGYFQLWQGKYRAAENSFERALALRSNFPEASRGLEQARKKNQVPEKRERTAQPKAEYPIDRDYRLLKKNAGNDRLRFQLSEELAAAGRYEEAFEQLEILKPRYADRKNFRMLYSKITAFKESGYRKSIEDLSLRFKENPSNGETASALSEAYLNLGKYKDSKYVLDKYFSINPNDSNQKLRFQYAKTLAWNKSFKEAKGICDSLIKDDPENLNYKLFSAQISVWTNEDLPLAASYLDEYLREKPNDIDALVALGGLRLLRQDIAGADSVYLKAKKFAPEDERTLKLRANIGYWKAKCEEIKDYSVLEEGRKQFKKERYDSALVFYDRYMSKAKLTDDLYKEYADLCVSAGRYDKAIGIYDRLLSSRSYDEKIAMSRALAYSSKGDSVAALNAFRALSKRSPKNLYARLYLGDSYLRLGKSDSAQQVYLRLGMEKLDSTLSSEVQKRYSWLPKSGSFVQRFPYYVSLAPEGAFYSDNMGYRMKKVGARLEIGAASFLAFGGGLYKTYLKGDQSDKDYNTFKGFMFLNFSKEFKGEAGFGRMATSYKSLGNESSLGLNYNREGRLSFNLTLLSTDARAILYSPNIIDSTYRADFYKLTGTYQHISGFILSGYYQYISISDGNQGNDFEFRIGRKFLPELKSGYEYFFSNYKYVNRKEYYSPHNFESHCLWADWLIEKESDYSVNVGGKIGYVPGSNFVIREGYAEGSFRPYASFNINARVTAGNSYRFDSAYSYVSGLLSLYLNIF